MNRCPAAFRVTGMTVSRCCFKASALRAVMSRVTMTGRASFGAAMAGGCSCFDGMMVSVMAYSIVDFGKTSNGGGRRARLLFGGLDALANERPMRFTAFG